MLLLVNPSILVTVHMNVEQLAQKVELRLAEVGRHLEDLGRKAADTGVGEHLKDPPLLDPIRYRKLLITLLKVLAVLELVSAYLVGSRSGSWTRFGVDLVIAGVLFVMWERIVAAIRERKKITRHKIESEAGAVRFWDALLFSLLWSDEILRDIPADRHRFVVISYTLIAIAVVAAFMQIGSGLMPLVITGALVMAAVNLLIWVVALERSEKETLQTELRLARAVQMSLMPKEHPTVEGFDIAGVSLPAREVGGDLFEYMRFSGTEDVFGIAVSDVSGKGLQAALSAVFTSGALATEVRRASSPGEILTRMNKAVFSHSQRGQFVAFLLAAIDQREKTLTFANAGQTKPLLLTPQGAEWLDGVGVHFPLGILEESQFEERTVRLDRETTLLLLTDGFTDAMNEAHEPFGNERIEEFLRCGGAHQGSAREILEALTAEVRRHVGDAPQHDDMTLVVVKAT
jgi:serine phosphatase RsbU (regulator of sigma subunit)